MAYWVHQGGVNSGIVGDAPHAATGTSYHLGKSQLRRDAYSIQLPRDRSGLSEAASAIDLGQLDGSLRGLQQFSSWLVDTLRATDRARVPWRDVREVIYSPDGVYVKRWNAVDNKVYTSLRKNADGSVTTITPGQGDATHLWHTHISFYRDSETRDKLELFRPYFEPAEETEMFNVSPPWAGLSLSEGDALYVSPAKAAARTEAERVDPNNVTISGDPLPRRLRLLGRFENDVRVVAYKAPGAHYTRTWFARPGVGAIVSLTPEELGFNVPQ
jgi:hypothetical protein